jgi:long-chain acyl-CoA synthetase
VPLEEKLQLSPFVAQCVVYGADRPHNVALIIPDKASLASWASEQNIATGDGLLQDPRTLKLFQGEIDKLSVDFKGFEKPRAFILDSEEFTTDNGMLTPTLKLKRRNVLTKYEGRLKALYA